MKRVFLFVLTVLSLTGCKSSKPAVVADRSTNDEIAASDSIAFLIMTIAQNSATQKNEIIKQRIKVSAGTLKTETHSAIAANQLKGYIWQGGVLRDSVIVNHPLYKHFEYFDDGGKATAKDTLVNKAEFFLRFQKPVADAEIRLFEQIKNASPSHLITIKL